MMTFETTFQNYNLEKEKHVEVAIKATILVRPQITKNMSFRLGFKYLLLALG